MQPNIPQRALWIEIVMWFQINIFFSFDSSKILLKVKFFYKAIWVCTHSSFFKLFFLHIFLQHSKNAIKHSTPEVKEGERGEVRTTIFGSPCNVYPPFSAKELRQDYLGCQALPTALWIKKLLSSSEETEFGQDYANEPWA